MRSLILGFIIMADINNTSVDQIIKENSKSELQYETFKQIYQDTIDKYTIMIQKQPTQTNFTLLLLLHNLYLKCKLYPIFN